MIPGGHQIDPDLLDDREFLRRFERTELSRFGHREHVRMAFAYLREGGQEHALRAARTGIRRLAGAAGAPGKYHETLTAGWVRAVAHFANAEPRASFAELLDRHPQLLRRDLLSAHYSDELLFSEAARRAYVEPDRAAFPVS